MSKSYVLWGNKAYSCKGTALAGANYLKCFGFDAEPKLINGLWRVVIYQ